MLARRSVMAIALASFLFAQGQAAWADEPESSSSREPPATSEPSAGAPAGARGSFIDADGSLRSFEDSYDDWFRKPRGPKRFGIAALESAAVLGIGLSYYWLRADFNRVDWDRPSLGDRVTFGAWRFDNNSNLFNHILHPLAGANFYGTARVNNLSVLQSSIYSATASFVWEFALEWRELVSINDLIFTPISGVAVGEFLFQLGDYLTSTPATRPWHTIGAYTFGLYRSAHELAARSRKPIALPVDNLGYSTAYWHRFYLAGEMIGIAGSDHFDELYGLRGSAELATIPGFARPGHFDLTFSNGDFTTGEFDIALNADDRFDTDLWASASLYGRYSQDYEQVGAKHALRGRATLLSVDTAFRFSDHSFSDRSDQVAVAHAVAPTARFWFKNGPWRLDFDVGASFDFAAVRSLAFEEWRSGRDVSGVKSVLIEKNYQFHLGGSGRTHLVLGLGRLSLGLSGSVGAYDSLEGLDRKQELVTDDVSGDEQIYEYEAYFSGGIPHTALEFRFAVDRFGRSSTISNFTVERWDTRLTGSFGASF